MVVVVKSWVRKPCGAKPGTNNLGNEWSAEEEAALLAGEPTPLRTDAARRSKLSQIRLRMGVRQKGKRFNSYHPPEPGPRDPKWWRPVQLAHASGMQIPELMIAFNRSAKMIHYALYPKARERVKKAVRRYEQNMKQNNPDKYAEKRARHNATRTQNHKERLVHELIREEAKKQGRRYRDVRDQIEYGARI